jgi:hypothetical protein
MQRADFELLVQCVADIEVICSRTCQLSPETTAGREGLHIAV